jgi:hypothetical protein
MIFHTAIHAAVVTLKNFFHHILPCPDLRKTVCPALETPHAVDHLQGKPAARGLEAAVAEIKYNYC